MRYSMHMFTLASSTAIFVSTSTELGILIFIVISGIVGAAVGLVGVAYAGRKLTSVITGGDTSEWTPIFKNGVYTHYSGRKKGKYYQTRLDESY